MARNCKAASGSVVPTRIEAVAGSNLAVLRNAASDGIGFTTHNGLCANLQKDYRSGICGSSSDRWRRLDPRTQGGSMTWLITPDEPCVAGDRQRVARW